MKLIAEITDPELMMKLQHEKGASFFKPTGEKPGTYEVLYFSGNKVVHFEGELTAAQLELLKAQANQCTIIDLDLNQGFVRIVQ